MTRVLERVSLLATETEIDPATGHGPEWGKAAPVALLIIVLMGIALYFLIKSMNKQMKKVPASFEADALQVPESVDVTSDPVEDDQAAGEATPAQPPTARSGRARGHRSS
jgi:hypothetical protein